MKYNAKDLIELQKISFNFAFYRTGDIDTAYDICSQVINLLILKFERINPGAAKSWVIDLTNNYCNKHLDKLKKDKLLSRAINEQHHKRIHKIIGIERDLALHKAYTDAYNALSGKELSAILFYFQCNRNIAEMQRIIGVSYTSLRQQVSLIKRTLKAETYKNLEVIATKKILTPQLNNLILKYLKRFKEHLGSNVSLEEGIQTGRLDFNSERINEISKVSPGYIENDEYEVMEVTPGYVIIIIDGYICIIPRNYT